MKILHLCWGLEPTNGAANIARLFMEEQRASGHDVRIASRYTRAEIVECDELWCHCGWYWRIWIAVAQARRLGKKVRWVAECCYDPVRLAYHGWKKRLVGPFERRALRKCDTIVATCRAEAEWIRAYLGDSCPEVVVSDIRRFFKFRPVESSPSDSCDIHVLYLGRQHKLKGTRYLVEAVERLNSEGGKRRYELKMVSGHMGNELEEDWRWCDVLCLPTLSDNFGLVVAEALERGKRVVTTDGAPAWEDQPGIGYIRGYRSATDSERVAMLEDAIGRCV